MNIPVICLTGSNGKTTTKELIHEILKQKYNVLATRGNFNNHIGVPLTLLRITVQNEMAVIELGANHVGEIARLCDIACPSHGLITNIGRAHIDGFGSLEGIISGKTELYRYLDQQQGTVFYHADNDILSEQLTNLSMKKISYGTKPSTDVQGGLLDTYPYLKLKVISDKYHRELTEISSYLVGSYNYENILAAICIGYHFGISEQQAKEAVEKYIPSNNRSQYLKTEKNEIIIDCYNANPTSMKAAILGFSEDPARDKLLIIGDMFELGDSSMNEHQELLNFAETLKNMEIFTAGPFFKACHASRATQFDDVESLGKYLGQTPPLSRKILLKGSRGMKLETILDYL
jgi:UDP-N-acetylmuramoyl-tripeptide--D-alanyl-D-alanine ligase